MKKNVKLAYAVLLIALAVFCVVVFAVPTAKTAAFWIAFVFTVIAFILQAFIWSIALGRGTPLKIKFLGLSLIQYGAIYLVIQLLAFVAFMANSILSSWIPLVVCTLILGIAAVCLIAAMIGKNEVSRVEQSVQDRMSFIREMQSEVEILAAAEQNKETKTALVRLGEQIRYSDPISGEELSAAELTIAQQVAELKNCTTDKSEIIQMISTALADRNRACKLNK